MTDTTARLHLVGVRPLNIAALMELQERNFRLLEQLLPELDPPFDEAVSRASGEPALCLTVTARDRFTIGLRLAYTMDDGRREPGFWIRVYRDARLAEATPLPERPRWTARDEDDPEALAFLRRQWDQNLMLHKWLSYLLDRGHGFEMAQRPRLGDGRG